MPEDKFLSRSFKTFLADKLKNKGFKAASPENLSARQVLGVPNLSSGNLEPQFSICQTSFLSSRKLRVGSSDRCFMVWTCSFVDPPSRTILANPSGNRPEKAKVDSSFMPCWCGWTLSHTDGHGNDGPEDLGQLGGHDSLSCSTSKCQGQDT